MNIQSIFVLAIVLLLAALALRYLLRQTPKGSGGCSGCGNCTSCESCTSKKIPQNSEKK